MFAVESDAVRRFVFVEGHSDRRGWTQLQVSPSRDAFSSDSIAPNRFGDDPRKTDAAPA
jgi:hypothetical protein